MKKFFKRTGLLLAAAFIGAAAMQAQKSPQDMDRFIDALMKRMTVEEKIGQLNLPVTGEITTGQAKSSDVAKKIEQGLVGGLFNLKGVDKIRDVQKLAVENSRLGIPLLFGMDVIHGYETIFPIPAPSAVKPSVQKESCRVSWEVTLIPLRQTSANTSTIGTELYIAATGNSERYANALPPTHHT